MERVKNNSMSRRTRYGDLKLVMEIVGCDANFMATVEGLDEGVVRDDEEVSKDLINEF